MPEEPPTTTCPEAHVLDVPHVAAIAKRRESISETTRLASTYSVADVVAVDRSTAHSACLHAASATARRRRGKLAITRLPFAPATSTTQAHNDAACTTCCERTSC